MVHFIGLSYKIGSLSRTRFNGTLERVRNPARTQRLPSTKVIPRRGSEKAYEIEPSVNSSFGVIGSPFSSIALTISKEASTEAIVKNNDESARCRPGHNLEECYASRSEYYSGK
jgi:hypothetical protein